jgi:predicted MFS family arabinose efflux permease
MELALVPLLLPAIQSQFHLTISELAWVFNSYGVTVALGVLLGGILGDNLNTTRLFGVGVLLFAAGSTLVVYAGSYETVIAGRLLQGFGGGIFSPLVPLLLTRANPRQPGKALIVWGSVVGFVAATTPFIYSSVLADYGWKLGFVIFAVLSLVAMTMVHESKKRKEPTSFPRSFPRISKLFESRDLWVMFVYVFCTYGSITYFLFRLPLWLSDNQFHMVSIGVTLSILWLSFSIASTFLRNLVDEPHVLKILLAAPAFIASAFLLAYLCPGIICLVISSILVGFGLACSNAPSTQLVLKFAPAGLSAASASIDISFARLGGVATVTLLAQSMFGYAVLAVVLLCLIAFTCALAVLAR